MVFDISDYLSEIDSLSTSSGNIQESKKTKDEKRDESIEKTKKHRAHTAISEETNEHPPQPIEERTKKKNTSTK